MVASACDLLCSSKKSLRNTVLFALRKASSTILTIPKRFDSYWLVYPVHARGPVGRGLVYTFSISMDSVLPGRFVVPEIVATHFLFKTGAVVADVGAGSGFYLKILSEMVGESGRVFACEIQKNLVEKLAEVVRIQQLPNVTPLWCDLEEPQGIKIRDGVLDGAILVNTLFQIEDKDTALTEMRRIMKTGGVLHVVDWTESFGGLGPAPNQVITMAAAIDVLESHRFFFEREYPAGDHHYGVAFKAV
jgi:SAM-dependent methyltransferase